MQVTENDTGMVMIAFLLCFQAYILGTSYPAEEVKTQIDWVRMLTCAQVSMHFFFQQIYRGTVICQALIQLLRKHQRTKRMKTLFLWTL